MSVPSSGCQYKSSCVKVQLLNIPSDSRDKINIIEDTLKVVPCDKIAGFVIYDLPGRDCAAKASNGELAVGDISIYKSEYIDRKCFSIRQYFVNTNGL